jgi:STE24 endopeptidase
MNESRAARYQRLRRRAEAVSGIAGGSLLITCVATPAGESLAAWARRAAAGVPAPFHGLAEASLFVAALALAFEIVALPAVIYLSASLDRRFKRSEHDVSGLVAAQLHAAAFGVLFAIVIGGVAHLSAQQTGGWWWLVTGLTLSAFLAAAVRGISTLIARSGAARPLADDRLKARLTAVSASAGVPVAGIFEWRASGDTSHSASVTGFGRGRRVLIAPEILSEWTEDEITVVVAHELSHHKHHDLVQALVVDALLMSTALAMADLALRAAAVPAISLPALPIVALVAGGVWVAVTPARHALSRWQERRADQFALAVTGEAAAFAAAVRRVGERNLIEDRPDALTRWFFHRHPTIEERLAMAGKADRV